MMHGAVLRWVIVLLFALAVIGAVATAAVLTRYEYYVFGRVRIDRWTGQRQEWRCEGIIPAWVRCQWR